MAPMNIQYAQKEGLARNPREKGEKKLQLRLTITQTQTHIHYQMHTQMHGPAAVGGESNSDEQLQCYKVGSKSIKRDNKIAIEFL